MGLLGLVGAGEGVPGQGVRSKRCQCNCGGIGYQTSTIMLCFQGGGYTPAADKD